MLRYRVKTPADADHPVRVCCGVFFFQMSVHLRFMLSYSVDGDVITEMAETTLPGQS